MKLLIINGPNLNLLGVREPEIYGKRSYAELEDYINNYCCENGIECEIFQSNHEGAIIDKIQQARELFDGIIINAAAYTHTSIAIADAVAAVALPTVEVHLSDPSTRESFRKISYLRPACKACFSGLGFNSYLEAIKLFVSDDKRLRQE